MDARLETEPDPRWHETAAVPRRIDTLQYLRAVAALSVVFYHASFYTNLYTGDSNFLQTFDGSFGTLGVLVFFALSGYLMAVQAVRMAGRPMLFMAQRLLRIYPIFWLICLVRIAVAYSLGNGQFDPLVLMLSPVGVRDYPLGVEWTLVYEVAFYILVCAVIIVRLERWIGFIGLAWIASIVLHTWAYGWYSPQFTTSLFAIPMSAVCSAFAAGLVIPTLLAKGWIGSSALPVAAFIMAAASFPRFTAFSTVITGIGCATLVGWVASLAQEGNRSPVMRRLGDWSYATYLVHVPVLVTLGTLTTGLRGLGLWAAMIVLVLALTPLFGMADITLHNRLRRAADGWRRRVLASVLAVFAGGFIACMALSVAQRHEEAATFGPITFGGGPAVETLERVGWHQDDRLAGTLEPLVRAGGLTYLSGWVNDPQNLLNRTSMLLLIGSTSIVAVPHSYRFDLIRAFRSARSVAPTALRKAIPDAACPPGLAVRAVAISPSDKVYHTLNVVNCPP
jgi:exopolysaccharide production protein ExoZ